MAEVIAKFKVSAIEIYEQPPKSHKVKLYPVYPAKNDPNWDENKKFHEATPSGSCEMFITNPAVFGIFNPGDEFYVEFTKVVKS